MPVYDFVKKHWEIYETKSAHSTFGERHPEAKDKE